MSQDAHELVSPAARIFPPWPPADGLLMRTARVGSWESQFVGAGRLTAFVSDHLLRFGAALDDIGLGVIFLQHHRVEVGLKLVLERAGGGRIPTEHRIGKLVSHCETAMQGAGLAREWTRLAASHDGFLAVFDKADPQSQAFRYPEDTKGRPVSRPPLVDLVELEAEGARFQRSVECLVDVLACREGLPLPPDAAVAAAREVAAAIRAVDAARAALDAIHRSFARTRAELDMSEREATALMAEAQAKADAQRAIMVGLRRPLARTLTLLESQAAARSDQIAAAPDAIEDFPSLAAPHPEALLRHLDRQVDWVGDTLARHVRDLGEALRAVYELSTDWPGLASRQLHSDLGRFLARVFVNFPADDAPRERGEVSAS